MRQKIHHKSPALITFLIILWTLASCGGGSTTSETQATSTAPSTTIVLPVTDGKPDVSTILGIDSNNNGVRDEVEVSMATSVGNDAATWTGLIKLAQTYQSWLANPTKDKSIARSRILAALTLAKCIAKTSPRTIPELDLLMQELSIKTFSTAGRAQILNDMYIAAGAFVVPPSLGSTC